MKKGHRVVESLTQPRVSCSRQRQKTLLESLKRIQERGLIEVVPKIRPRARETIVIRESDTRVYSTYLHGRRVTLSAVTLCELGKLLRLRWGRDQRAAFHRVGKVAGLFLHWLLIFRDGLSGDALAEATGRRKDSVVRYLKRLSSTKLVVYSGGRWMLPAGFWERFEQELEENCATSERLQEQKQERSREADEYWSSGDAPAARRAPSDPEDEQLRRGGWEPLWVEGKKLWRHPDTKQLIDLPTGEVVAAGKEQIRSVETLAGTNSVNPEEEPDLAEDDYYAFQARRQRELEAEGI